MGHKVRHAPGEGEIRECVTVYESGSKDHA